MNGKPFDPDEFDALGDKIIEGSCPECDSHGFNHEFAYRVSRLTDQRDFLRQTRCPNCGRRGLLFIKEYNV